jgi:hypothetical protein
MQKLILVSIIAITIVVPAVAAREPDPRKALRNAVIWTLMGIVLYALSVVFIYPRFPS